MEKFNELKDVVKNKGYGSSFFMNVNGVPVYLSCGIKEVFLDNQDDEQKIIDAVGRFQKNDYGNAVDYGKSPRPGHEYGRYEISPYQDDSDDTAVWMHRTEEAMLVYFKFER